MLRQLRFFKDAIVKAGITPVPRTRDRELEIDELEARMPPSPPRRAAGRTLLRVLAPLSPRPAADRPVLRCHAPPRRS